MNNMNSYKTTDLHLITYLDMMGHQYEIQKEGNQGTAVFSEELDSVQKSVSDYFSDLGKFQTFGSKMRNVKSRIRNTN